MLAKREMFSLFLIFYLYIKELLDWLNVEPQIVLFQQQVKQQNKKNLRILK